MQKKLIIIAAIILLLLVLAGGAIFLQSKKSAGVQTQTQNQNPPKAENQTTPSTISGSIKDLLSGGKNQACTINYPDNMGQGNIYIADKKFGGDFTIKTANGKETTGHMVSDGTYMYSWSSEAKIGVKMNLAKAQETTSSTQKGSVDLNQKVDFKCSPWIVDDSKFTLPTDIQFTDLTKMMQQAAPNGATQTQNTASPCDQITDPTAKTACAKALNQNGSGY